MDSLERSNLHSPAPELKRSTLKSSPPQLVRVLETAEAHCGYHFSWSISNFLPLYGGADFHDYHHRQLYTKSGNYSSTFVYMEWYKSSILCNKI
uniref:Fatty acid hydroxylase domain-containing protein n=1 Tax=Daucus carota subsp. sativus TaxID=79200 RepID=A0A166E156_DAUCS